MAMVLLAIAAAGVLLPFANAASVQAEGARQTLAASLASELMEKISISNYADLMATYDGYEEADGALMDAADGIHSGSAYSGFSRRVTCQETTVGDPALGDQIELVAVTVTVSHNGGEMTRVTTLIGNHE